MYSNRLEIIFIITHGIDTRNILFYINPKNTFKSV